MAVINRIAGFAEDMATWRRHLHQTPELGFDCHQTAAFVVERLREFGITEIQTGIATSGLVAVIEGQGDGPTIGLRADMDALPIAEETGAAWASSEPGKMHACGHDGHTVMLLGAARYLAETRNFKGRVALVFQPAEESGGGAGVMVEEGIMERFAIDEVYALHTNPYHPVGQFITAPGPIMAGVDDWSIEITGVGGHAAYPQDGTDPLLPAAAMAQAIAGLAAPYAAEGHRLVVAVTQIIGGNAHNIVPTTASLAGTLRYFDAGLRDQVLDRMSALIEGLSSAYGVSARLDYRREYPPTINHPSVMAQCLEVATEISGPENVIPDVQPEMGAEDFAFMLNARPGAYFYLGQGEGPGLHHPEFDFNDEAAPYGASFFARLVETKNPI